MSRTYKDKPSKFRYDPWDKDKEVIQGVFRYIQLPTTKVKKRKEVDTEWHWMSTPSWWNRLQHTRPERRKVNVALHMVSDVEEADIPDLGRKPHIYFW